MTIDRRAVLIVNTRSRQGQDLCQTAHEALVRKGIRLDAARPVCDSGELHRAITEAIEQGSTFIIIGGGDGTISSGIAAFAYSDVVLGILPFGTANNFARTLGIPLDLEGAIEVLVQGKVETVDLGKVNDRYFTSGVSIGLPVAVGQAATGDVKRRLGRAGYLLVACRQFVRYRPFQCVVETDSRRAAVQAIGVRIANGCYEGGMRVADEAGVQSGALSVRVLKGASKWGLLKHWAQMSLGRKPSRSDLDVFRVTEATIETSPPQDVLVDGEVGLCTPLRVSVAHRALRIMLPQDFDASPS